MGYPDPPDAPLRASVERLIGDPATDYLLGAPAGADDTADPAAAGVCQLRYRHSVWTGADDCWLEDLYVTDAARGTGLGRALVEAAFARATERGCVRIQLDVNTANPRAHGLYEALGFSSWEEPPGGDKLLMGRRLA
ncbi:MAG: hypothetical protein QOJ07_667 [Thermoleophilaceae bacterium]|nr:hypothetical protein [Thermoleophilaceae bacterium]